jgi:hypothetical protein
MSDTVRSMTTEYELKGSGRPMRFAGIGLALVWVAASLWQQWSWTLTSFGAITCGQAAFPVYTTWTVVTTIVIVIVSALFHLGVVADRARRSGSVIISTGLVLSLTIGVVVLVPIFALFTGQKGLGGPLPTIREAIDEAFVLGMFIGPPIAGIVSVVVARSQTVLRKIGRARRARLAFGIAAGLTALSFVAAYGAVALNCFDKGSILQ